MTTQEFKRIGQLLKKAYGELEDQAIKEGISLISDQYEALVNKTREAVLSKNGFTLQEYQGVKNGLANDKKSSTVTKQDFVEAIGGIHDKLKQIDEKKNLNEEDVKGLAHEVAKQYIVPPVITNQIVKETTIEKPTIVKETKTEVVNQEYNDQPLKDLVESLDKKVSDIKIPVFPDIEKFKQEMYLGFDASLKEATNTLNMPDFRRMGMGLESRISVLESKPSGGSQTPWTSDIDGAGFLLRHIRGIQNNADYNIVIDAGTNGSQVAVTIGDGTNGGDLIMESGASDTAGNIRLLAGAGTTNGGNVNITAGIGGSTNGVINLNSNTQLQQGLADSTNSLGTLGQALISTGSQVVWGATPFADGTYTVGIGITQNGTITIVNGIITNIQEAS